MTISTSPSPPFHVYLLSVISLFKFLTFSLSGGGCLYFRVSLVSGVRPPHGHRAFLVSLEHSAGSHPFLGVALLSNERLVRAVLLTPEQHARIN